MWSTSGPWGSKGTGSAGWTDGHMPRGRSLLETLLLGEPPMHQGPPEGSRAASLSQGGGSGQAVLARSSGDPFLQDTGLLPVISEQQKQDAVLTCSDHVAARRTLGYGRAWQMPSQQCRGVLMLNLNHQADQLLSCVASIFSCLPFLSRAGPMQCLLTLASLTHHKKMSSIPEE